MKITITIEDGFGYFNRDCFTCGAFFETGESVNRVNIVDDVGDQDTSLICDDCATSGIDSVRVRLRERARSARRWADGLEKIAAGEFDIPGPEEAKAMIEKIDREAAKFWADLDEGAIL